MFVSLAAAGRYILGELELARRDLLQEVPVRLWRARARAGREKSEIRGDRGCDATVGTHLGVLDSLDGESDGEPC